jgi:hypothetical protein
MRRVATMPAGRPAVVRFVFAYAVLREAGCGRVGAVKAAASVVKLSTARRRRAALEAVWRPCPERALLEAPVCSRGDWPHDTCNGHPCKPMARLMAGERPCACARDVTTFGPKRPNEPRWLYGECDGSCT